MKFRLKVGKYSHGGVTHDQGAVVESDSDLVKKFGALKFERLDGGNRGQTVKKSTTAENFDSDEEEIEEVEAEVEETEEAPSSVSNSELEDMTVAELNEFAAADEIDLEGATKKADILRAIKRTLKERVLGG